MTRQDQQQALALGAIFQSALLADEVAASGESRPQLVRPLLDAVLTLQGESADQVYTDPASLAPGLRLLQAALRGGQRPDNMRPISYALSLIQLANFVRRDSDLVSVLRHRLEALAGQEQSGLAGDSLADRCRRFAGVYVDTLGTLRFRIRVQGEPRHLQNEDNASAIRALFLAGVRAAFLWHQAGGRRWHLLFSRRRLLATVEALLSSP